MDCKGKIICVAIYYVRIMIQPSHINALATLAIKYPIHYQICDRPQENWPSLHLVMIVGIPILKSFN